MTLEGPNLSGFDAFILALNSSSHIPIKLLGWRDGRCGVVSAHFRQTSAIIILTRKRNCKFSTYGSAQRRTSAQPEPGHASGYLAAISHRESLDLLLVALSRIERNYLKFEKVVGVWGLTTWQSLTHARTKRVSTFFFNRRLGSCKAETLNRFSALQHDDWDVLSLRAFHFTFFSGAMTAIVQHNIIDKFNLILWNTCCCVMVFPQFHIVIASWSVS